MRPSANCASASPMSEALRYHFAASCVLLRGLIAAGKVVCGRGAVRIALGGDPAGCYGGVRVDGFERKRGEPAAFGELGVLRRQCGRFDGARLRRRRCAGAAEGRLFRPRSSGSADGRGRRRRSPGTSGYGPEAPRPFRSRARPRNAPARRRIRRLAATTAPSSASSVASSVGGTCGRSPATRAATANSSARPVAAADALSQFGVAIKATMTKSATTLEHSPNCRDVGRRA